jgi:hypothetical protein
VIGNLIRVLDKLHFRNRNLSLIEICVLQMSQNLCGKLFEIFLVFLFFVGGYFILILRFDDGYFVFIGLITLFD